MPDLIDQLQALPDDWGLVAVGHNKRPYLDEWQNNPLTKEQVAKEIKAGRAKAVGVMAGPQSGGLLFVDHDGISASEVLNNIGAPLATLPKSWAMTSGRNGRLQIIYKVPERYWAHIKTKKIKSGKEDDEGNKEQLELRWAGCQSVVLGSHPITGSYKWIDKRSPSEERLREAPKALIKQMMRAPKPEPAPLLISPPVPSVRPLEDDSERARSYLESLNSARADDYDDWLAVGMALHSLSDPSLLSDWEAWSSTSSKYNPGDCDKKWNGFKEGGTNLGTLGHFAKQDGWKPKPKSKRSKPKSKTSPVHLDPMPDEPAVSLSAARKLEPVELLQHLRLKNAETDAKGVIRKKKNAEIRYNIFTQQIELSGKVMKGAERFYLGLAEMGYKVEKNLAFDCLITVAQENEHDPVKEYLEFVAENVEPEYIESLATQYLRPDDKPQAPTLYDHMLKATLIAAVKRCFEPGCKHDTACVLMGDQGARKSSFWNVLGGEFFSDSLKDISSKDDLMVLHRSWIMEWAELDHLTGKKHAGQVKAFLSQHTDMFRVPYGKATEQFPRRGIVVGSTNKSTGFLVDETGNRRFWVIPTPLDTQNPIDTASLALERDGIWAAAVHAYRKGEKSYLTAEQEEIVADENSNYLISNPWEPVIKSWLLTNAGSTITTEAILTEAVMKPIERQTKGDQMQVADVLRSLNYERKRVMVSGSRSWRWERL